MSRSPMRTRRWRPLIDKGVIAFKDARADLLPPAVEVEDHEDA